MTTEREAEKPGELREDDVSSADRLDDRVQEEELPGDASGDPAED